MLWPAKAQGGVYPVRLTTNIEPELCTYTSSASWVTVAPATRSVRTDELVITVAENTAAARSATLTISCEGIMDDIEVSIAQEASATCPSVNGICFDECSYEGFLKAEAKFTTGQKAVFTNIGNIEEKLQPSFWAVAGEDVVFNALSADVVLYMKISDGLIYTEYPETARIPGCLVDERGRPVRPSRRSRRTDCTRRYGDHSGAQNLPGSGLPTASSRPLPMWISVRIRFSSSTARCMAITDSIMEPVKTTA